MEEDPDPWANPVEATIPHSHWATMGGKHLSPVGNASGVDHSAASGLTEAIQELYPEVPARCEVWTLLDHNLHSFLGLNVLLDTWK
ncbi:hypothetical protein OIU74_021425 [Salix koriyanagi]|uniref:Uncharacterized protein n=1 Tax=Salix koriyanagi TaxID=2511006 RepID=A0A9Q0WIT7_9ROSI|nr:hypothetical protein OIU74_021425 [Salix koriyanagi]